MNQRRRIVIDFIVEYPPQFTTNMIAGIMQDYIKLNRFNAVDTEVKVSVYPENTRIVQQAISLASDLNDIKQ